MIIIWCILVILLLYVYIHFSTQSRLIDKMFPGPLRLPFIGTLTYKMFSSEGCYDFFLQSAKSYNYRPYRIWFMHKPYVIIPDYRLARVVLSKLKYTDKADAYNAFVPWMGRNHYVGSGEAWLRYRKHDMHAFRYQEIIQFVQPFKKNSDILCRKLSTHVGKEAFDISSYISKYSLDNICESIIGTQLHAQNTEHCPYEEALENMSKIIVLKIQIPILRIDWLCNLTPISRLQSNSIKIFRDYSETIIREKRASAVMEKKQSNENHSRNNETVSFVDRIITENKGKYTHEEIQIEIESCMFAGHDTVKSALNFIFYTLAEHQEIQEKVYHELRDIFGDSTIDLNISQLNNMKYTEQVIKETLRTYPVGPLVARHIKDDIHINEKQFIPKDTNVILNLAAIHRDPVNWPNPDIFDPDRFSQESSRKRDPYAFLAFSAGPRNCLGYHMAMIEMKITIAQVVQKFRLSLSDDPRHKIKPAYTLLLTSSNGFHVKVESRVNAQEKKATQNQMWP